MKTMNHMLASPTTHPIGPRHGLALRDARGHTVTCLCGSIWLTMEGDRRDIVLAPGASFVVDRDGLTLLAAQRPSSLQLSARQLAGGWWFRVVNAIKQMPGPGAKPPNPAWAYYKEIS